MVGVYVLAVVFFVLFLCCLGMFSWGLFNNEAGPAMFGIIFGAALLMAAIANFQNAVYVETTCSTQGLHTVAGKCVELIEVE